MPSPNQYRTMLSIGEAMIEFSSVHKPKGGALAFAGDTFNMAYYFRQLSHPDCEVNFFTGVGDDSLSRQFASFALENGISDRYFQVQKEASLGCYLISLDGAERSFHYWRDHSAATQLVKNTAALEQALDRTDLAFLSGITIAILSESDRAFLFDALDRCSATIAFDPNFRPQLWENAASARTWIEKFASIADFVFPSSDDEQTLFNDQTPAQTADRYLAAGAKCVVVKCGSGPCLLAHADERLFVNPTPIAQPIVDTTSAGDSFNAGFLAACLQGASLPDACSFAHHVAAQVITKFGALTPLDPITIQQQDPNPNVIPAGT